ncbi:hypothetical protein ACWEQL_40270, partial [Kitasatospora sp. NPDC004240]
PGRPARVLAAAPGQPCTGVWEPLAALVPGPGEPALRVALAEYDRSLRYLALCVTTLDPEPEPSEEAAR